MMPMVETLYCKHCGQAVEWFFEYYQHVGTEEMYCPDEENCAEPVAPKRLSGPELAAEYHAWDALARREQYYEVCQGDDWDDRDRAGQEKMYEKLNTVYRFATLPHYDEVA